MRRISRAALAVALIVALCIGANVLAFCIDSQDMRDHTWQGCLMLGEQGGTPQHVGGFASAQLDNFTAVLILKTAGYVGPESLLHKAFAGYRVEMAPQDGQSDWAAFCHYDFAENSPSGSGVGYARYWHGYTLPLRLLLCVFDVANLQMLLYFAHLVLLLWVLSLMRGRGLAALTPGFFLSYFLLMPFTASVCLQYVPVTTLMLLGCVLVLKWDEAIDRAISMPGFFAVLGVLTNYFDFLTFPMVALCFPLVLLLALRMRRGDGFGRLFVTTALCGCCWALGFAGMWALKWLMTALVFGWDTLLGVMEQIGLRSGTDGGELSRIAVLMENLNVIFAKKSYLALIGLCALATIAPAARAMLRRERTRLDLRALVMLLPAAAACVWVLVMANHASDHTYFTYRTLTVVTLGGFAALACALQPDIDAK